MSTPTKTPVKYSHRLALTPSAKFFCFVCGKTEERKSCRRQLFCNSEKTDVCKFLETALEITVTAATIACTCCIGRVRTAYKTLSAFKESTRANLKELTSRYKSVTAKRCAADTPSSRKSLFQGKNDASVDMSKEQAKSDIQEDGEEKNTLPIFLPVPPQYSEVAMAILKEDEDSIVESVYRIPSLKDRIIKNVCDTVSYEAESLCKDRGSNFHDRTASGLKNWSFTGQQEELKKSAPNINRILNSITRKEESPHIRAGQLTALSVLLHCRNRNVNANAALMSLILKKGGAKKAVFKRLSALHLCVSYNTTLRLQTQMGADFDMPVKMWAEKVHSDALEERKLQVETGDGAEAQTGKKSDTHPGYKVVGDNVDFKAKARHMTLKNQNKDHHMFNTMAVKHRVPSEHLDNTNPKKDITTTPYSTFLPNHQESLLYRQELIVITGRIISHYCPELSWISKILPRHIPHEFLDLTKQKTEVYGLGVIDCNESTSDGIIDIMEYLHQYVPGHNKEGPVKILSGGDLLTAEREFNAQQDLRDFDKFSDRLHGLVPNIEDMHTYANFMCVLWHQFYNTKSSKDIGTLYSARNYLNARNVPADPMKDLNASEELMLKYTDCLVLCAAMEYFGMANLKDRPTKHRQEDTFQDILSPINYVQHVLGEIVDLYVSTTIPQMGDDHPSTIYECPFCNKKYKQLTSLKKHTDNIHKQKSVPLMKQKRDDKFHYVTNALGQCLLLRNFLDARKLGDGERIVRLHKFMLLSFRQDGRIKYTHQVLHQIAQIECLLTPRLSFQLTWNRFVNNKGMIDSNIELDRELEHRNKYFKEDIKGFRGKITPQSIERVSRSSQAVQEVLCRFDEESFVKKDSGKHTKCSMDTDVLYLLEQMQAENLFKYIPGRFFLGFQHIQAHSFDGLDTIQLKEWMRKTLLSFSKMGIYERR